MGMKYVAVLASSLGVLACGCNGDGLDATVGVLGQPCQANLGSGDTCGSNLACGADGRIRTVSVRFVAGFAERRRVLSLIPVSGPCRLGESPT